MVYSLKKYISLFWMTMMKIGGILWLVINIILNDVCINIHTIAR